MDACDRDIKRPVGIAEDASTKMRNILNKTAGFYPVLHWALVFPQKKYIFLLRKNLSKFERGSRKRSS